MALSRLVTPATGAPNTAFFNAGNGNIGTGVLTQARLQAAITTVSTKRDEAGTLLSPGPLQLVVGPALQFDAQRLLAYNEIRDVAGNATMVGPNPLAGRIMLTVLENLPARPVRPPHPAGPAAGVLRRVPPWERDPDLGYQNDEAARAAGGAIGADEGDFDADAVYRRARHIVGSAQGDPKFTYASDGVGARP